MSATELAGRAGVGWATVQRFESSEGLPKSRSGTLERIKQVLEDAGVEFIGDPLKSPGVQLKRGPRQVASETREGGRRPGLRHRYRLKSNAAD
jgi:hypothetical protein